MEGRQKIRIRTNTLDFFLHVAAGLYSTVCGQLAFLFLETRHFSSLLTTFIHCCKLNIMETSLLIICFVRFVLMLISSSCEAFPHKWFLGCGSINTHVLRKYEKCTVPLLRPPPLHDTAWIPIWFKIQLELGNTLEDGCLILVTLRIPCLYFTK